MRSETPLLPDFPRPADHTAAEAPAGAAAGRLPPPGRPDADHAFLWSSAGADGCGSESPAWPAGATWSESAGGVVASDRSVSGWSGGLGTAIVLVGLSEPAGTVGDPGAGES
jgi:hypothetical protein